MYNSTDTELEEKKDSSPYGLSVILFILNIIIITSASLEQFELIGLGDRWSFHYGMMWCAISALIALIITSWIACVTIVSENETCEVLLKCLGGLCGIGLVVIMVVQYVLMGQLWHTDPHHTIPFYGTFWTDGVTDMNINLQPIANTTVVTLLNTNVGNITNATRQLQVLTGSYSVISTLPNLRGSIHSSRRRLQTAMASKWVYVMSDVVIRIYGFLLMLLPVLIAFVSCCGGTAYICGHSVRNTN